MLMVFSQYKAHGLKWIVSQEKVNNCTILSSNELQDYTHQAIVIGDSGGDGYLHARLVREHQPLGTSNAERDWWEGGRRMEQPLGGTGKVH